MPPVILWALGTVGALALAKLVVRYWPKYPASCRSWVSVSMA